MWQKEEVMELYNTIFHRKSVRKYQSTALDPAFLEEVRQTAAQLFALVPESPVAFRILSGNQIKGFAPKAPHYLAVYTSAEPNALINAAFQLQQMDLWFSSRGIGTCWLGMPHPISEAGKADGLRYVICLSFGRADEAVHREHASEFSRKELSEITDASGIAPHLEAVRLAPSATNRQPWFISIHAGQVRLFLRRVGFIKNTLYGTMQWMDMGIALCHLWLAALAGDEFSGFSRETLAASDIPADYDYVWSMGIKNSPGGFITK